MENCNTETFLNSSSRQVRICKIDILKICIFLKVSLYCDFSNVDHIVWRLKNSSGFRIISVNQS